MAAILGRILSIISAYILAYYLRQEWLALYLGGPSTFVGYSEFLTTIIPLFLTMFYLRGVFAKSWIKKPLESRLGEGVFIHLILLATASMIAFYQQYHLFSRSFLLLFVLLSLLLFMILELIISRKTERAKKIVTVGKQSFFDSFKSFCKLRELKFVFMNVDKLLELDHVSAFKSLQILDPDEIWICDLSEYELKKLSTLVDSAQVSIQVRDMKSLSMLFYHNSDFEKYENYIMQFLREPNCLEYLDRGKRLTDLVILTMSSPIWLPLIITVSILLRLKQEQVFFRQSRVGQFGKVFSIVKFCSMKPVRADKSFTKSKAINDSRLTKYGWFLRRTSIDELPQLWNVIRGEMTLVGPRPELIEVVTQNYDTKHWKRSLIKPGLTGLWQICGRKQPIHDHLKYDFFYLKNRGLFFDLYIICKTIPAILKRNGAS